MSEGTQRVTCAHCGAPLTGQQKLYCSRNCRAAASSRRNYDPDKRRQRQQERGWGQRTCEVCGEQYIAHYKDQRTCGRHCGAILKLLNAGKPLSCSLLHGQHSDVGWCAACGQSFEAYGVRKYCAACADTQYLGGTWVRGVKVCEDCGAPIAVYSGSGNKCPECARARAKSYRREYRREYRRRTGQKNHRERARHYGVQYEPVNRQKVFERDGYRCHICGRKTNPNAKWNSPRYPTLDHIIPMSVGGPHSYKNTACACFECNSLKGAATGPHGDQLRLIG